MIFFLFLWSSLTSFASSHLWMSHAKHLIGENEGVRNKAINELKKIKDLNLILEKELLSDNKALALDVIVALQKNEFLPQLLQRVKDDSDGILTSAVNGLLSVTTKEVISAYYLQLLEYHSREIKPVVLITLIDALARIGSPIPLKKRVELMNHSFHEIRSAMLSYLRLSYLWHHRLPSHQDLALGLKQPSFQLRRQALFFLLELKDKSEFKNLFEICKKESDADLKKLCLSREFPQRKSFQ